MKVLFCIKAIDIPGGGAERVLADVASGLAERGHEVHVLSFDEPGGTSYYALHRDIERHALGIGTTDKSATPLETLQRLRALRRYVPGVQPDVVVGFMHSVFVPLGVALVGKGIPLVASEHIVPAHYRSRPLQALLFALTPLVSRSITVVSEQVRAAYPGWLRSRMHVVHNPVSLGSQAGRANPLGKGGQRRVLLTVGRLAPQKDHVTLLEAFARVAERLPQWDLRIVGEGVLRDEIEARIERLGLGGRVTLTGAVSEVGREYERAQLFVLPSRYESLGLALAEALAHGLPTVGFADCEGVNELIEPERNGCLVSGGGDRVAALAEGLEALMADDARRTRLAASACILPEELRIDRVLDRWEGLLAEVANQ